MAKEVLVKFKADTKGAEKNVKDLNDEIKETGEVSEKSNETINNGLDALDKKTGGAVSGLKAMKSGVVGLVGSMKSLRVAIMATGIGALLIALVSLRQAFTASEEGQNRWNKIMTVTSNVVARLLDLLADFGEAIIDVVSDPKQAIIDFGNLIKENLTNRLEGMLEIVPALGKAIGLFFKGEWSEAGKVATDAIGKVVLGVENITDKTMEAVDATKEYFKGVMEVAEGSARVADMRAKADLIERDLLIKRSELEAEIAELRLKSRQEEEFSARERGEFLRQAQALEEDLISKEVEYLTLRAEAQTLENTFARSNKENLDAEAQAIARVNQATTARLNSQRQTQRELNRINKEIARDEKARQAELERQEKERLKAIEDAKKERMTAIDEILKATLSAQEREIYETEKKYETLIELAKKYGQDVSSIEASMQEEVSKINQKYNKEELDRERALQQQKVGIIGQAIGAIGAVAEQGSDFQKAVAIAQAIWNTGVGVTEALKVPFPFNLIAAATVGATGFAQVRSILNTDVQQNGGTPMGGSAGAVAGQATSSRQGPNVALFSGGGNPFSQIEEAINSQRNQPIETFVVSKNVTSRQEFDRRTFEKAKLGG